MEAVPPLPELPPSLRGILPGCHWPGGVGSAGPSERIGQRGAGKPEKLQGGASGREGRGGVAPGERQ